MLKQSIYIVLLASVFNYSASGMEMVDLFTDATITGAIELSSPVWVATALDARRVGIQAEFQKRLKKEHKSYIKAREEAQGNRTLDVFSLTRLAAPHMVKMERIKQDYAVAQDHFRNKEVPAYLKFAQQVAKEPCTPKSELIAKGGVMVATSTLVSLALALGEASFGKLVLICGCVYGAYQGGKKIIDGLEYAEYIKRQKQARSDVIKVLKERQGNAFEQLVYKLQNI